MTHSTTVGTAPELWQRCGPLRVKEKLSPASSRNNLPSTDNSSVPTVAIAVACARPRRKSGFDQEQLARQVGRKHLFLHARTLEIELAAMAPAQHQAEFVVGRRCALPEEPGHLHLERGSDLVQRRDGDCGQPALDLAQPAHRAIDARGQRLDRHALGLAQIADLVAQVAV